MKAPDGTYVSRWEYVKEVLAGWFGYPHRHRYQRQSYPHRGWDGSVFYLRECVGCHRTKPYR